HRTTPRHWRRLPVRDARGPRFRSFAGISRPGRRIPRTAVWKENFARVVRQPPSRANYLARENSDRVWLGQHTIKTHQRTTCERWRICGRTGTGRRRGLSEVARQGTVFLLPDVPEPTASTNRAASRCQDLSRMPRTGISRRHELLPHLRRLPDLSSLNA